MLLNQRYDLDKIHRQRTTKLVMYVARTVLLLEALINTHAFRSIRRNIKKTASVDLSYFTTLLFYSEKEIDQ